MSKFERNTCITNTVASPDVLSDPPLSVVCNSQSNGITVELHQQPPLETDEHVIAHHLVSIQCGQSIVVEGQLDGRFFHHRSVPGDFAVLPTGTASWERWYDTAEFIAIRFSPNTLAQLVHQESLEDVALAADPKRYDPLIHQVGLTLATELQTLMDANHLYIDTLTTLLAVHLVQHYSTSTFPIQRDKGGLSHLVLHRVIEYIDANLAHRFTLQELANIAHLSCYHFSRQFKRATGFSPYQYVLYRRVERAKELLARQDLLIMEIATQVGFANQSQLTRYFKQFVGVTPTVFRQQTAR